MVQLRRRRRTICTVAVGQHAELHELARPGLERWALTHGYDLVVGDDDDLAAGRPPAWAKVRMLREVLDSSDLVVWVDADAVVVDPSADLATDLRPRGGPVGMVHAVVHRFGGGAIPSTGVLALRAGPFERWLLDRLWSAHEPLIGHRWWDNAAFIAELGGDPDDPSAPLRRGWMVNELDGRWNVLSQRPRADARILHFAGRSHADRLDGMRAAVRGEPLPAPRDPVQLIG